MVVLDSPRARRLGLRDPVVRACVFVARSVHTFGVAGPIGIAWISDDGVVVKRCVVQSNRFVVGPARTVVETRDPRRLPSVGTRLAVLP